MLFRKFPKFKITTPVPYYKLELQAKHKQNMVSIDNYLCANNLPVPNSIHDMTWHYGSQRITEELVNTLDSKNHFQRLKRLLNVFKLTMAPADKTQTLVILPTSTLEEELEIHLSDRETYKLLTTSESEKYTNSQHNAVADAARFYKNSKIVSKDPSSRYIYFLPKTHKEVYQWRSKYHPKMRPIICNTNSTTHQLAKHLLPKLQAIEKKFSSTIASSLAVTHNIQRINDSNTLPKDIHLTTIDVESLFTRIPQERLLDIVNLLLVNSDLLTNEEREKFLFYLKTIIQCNTFQVHETTYLQQIGLPMGGPLSGTLANIYLGHLEEDLWQLKGILLYNRYMDDVLVIATWGALELEDFLKRMKDTLQLTLTASTNKTSVNFLDMTVTMNRANRRLETSPHTKNYTFYPIPSIMGKKSIHRDTNIVTSQILRTWRISTNDQAFSKAVNHYLHFLTVHRYHRQLRKRIFHFLQPVKRSTHKWTTGIPLCESCYHTTLNKNIRVTKITTIGQHYIATRRPLNCTTKNIHTILQTSKKVTTLSITTSLHDLLHSTNCQENSSITPMGQLSPLSLETLAKKFPSIMLAQKKGNRKSWPCYIFDIYKSPQQFGIHTANKKRKTVATLLNNFKKIGRKKKPITAEGKMLRK
jgi:hypothetical protein